MTLKRSKYDSSQPKMSQISYKLLKHQDLLTIYLFLFLLYQQQRQRYTFTIVIFYYANYFQNVSESVRLINKKITHITSFLKEKKKKDNQISIKVMKIDISFIYQIKAPAIILKFLKLTSVLMKKPWVLFWEQQLEMYQVLL